MRLSPRRILSFLSILLTAASPPAFSDSTTLQWPGSGAANSNQLAIDDFGGGQTEYSFTFDGVSHTSTTTLFVSDGTGTASGNLSGGGSDFNGNGISSFGNLLPNIDQIALESDSPIQPVVMTNTNIPITIQQVAYVNNSKDYAIIEIRAVNTDTQNRPVFIAFANDWDVGGSASNIMSGFDEARALIYQQDIPDNYTIGMRSLIQPVHQYRLGDCCALSFSFNPNGNFLSPYLLQDQFLQNTQATELCDDGDANNATDACSPRCQPRPQGSACGNGTTEGDEECDDGNLMPNDGCDIRCNLENTLCGNGIVDLNEECEDNNRVSGDGCDLDCKVEFEEDFCGDGFLNNGATGNQIDPSEFPIDLESTIAVKFDAVAPQQGATAAFCLIGAKGVDLPAGLQSLQEKADDCLTFYQTDVAICGNGIQNANEACDNGMANSDTNPNACRTNCQIARCGDGVIDAGETCDDQNTQDGDCCSSTCQFEAESSACEDGNTNTLNDKCNATGSCLSGPACGDGTLEAGEACDDGNRTNGDCCNENCQFEAEGSVCEDGKTETINDQCNGAGGCSGSIKEPVCGNSIVEQNETCDDGNTKDGDCCSAACQIEQSRFCPQTPQNPGTSSGDGGCALSSTNQLSLYSLIWLFIPAFRLLRRLKQRN